MGDLRTLLERAAEGYEAPAEQYDRTLDRAKRLRSRRRLGAALLAVVIAAAGLSAAAVAFVGPRHAAPIIRTTTPSAAPAVVPGLTGEVVYKCGNTFCLMEADGTHRGHAQWGDAPSPQWDPAFSPDGTRVAYRGYYGRGAGMYALYVANADGTGAKRIPRDLAGDPAWSPDGSRIAFDTSGAGSIMATNPDGTGLRRLTPGALATYGIAFDDEQPAWSPFGQRIVFVRREVGPRSAPAQLYAM